MIPDFILYQVFFDLKNEMVESLEGILKDKKQAIKVLNDFQDEHGITQMMVTSKLAFILLVFN